MSSIRNITASTAVPDDLAKRLGPSGVNEILLTLWQGYHDLVAATETSIPAFTGIKLSASLAIVESGRFVTIKMCEPLLFACLTAVIVSAVSPD